MALQEDENRRNTFSTKNKNYVWLKYIANEKLKKWYNSNLFLILLWKIPGNSCAAEFRLIT